MSSVLLQLKDRLVRLSPDKQEGETENRETARARERRPLLTLAVSQSICVALLHVLLE